MMLKELIEALEAADQDYVAPIGLGRPMSWRGDYQQVAFEPVRNIRVADMLVNARSALGATFDGYKGGRYTMTEWSECYLDHFGECSGDKIGPVLMAYMTGQVLERNPGG